MPKHKKPASDSESPSDSDSGPDDIIPVKKSKSGSGKSKTNDQGETYWDLEKTRRVTVRSFKGKIYVDVREFYEKDGKLLPGKKGISLSRHQWSMLKNLANEIDEAVENCGP